MNRKPRKKIKSTKSFSNLYHTFSVDSHPLTPKQEDEIIKFCKDASPSSKEEILLIIVEHARVKDDFVIDVSSPVLPYSGVEGKDKNEISFDMTKLPNHLKKIIYKSIKLLKQNI